MRLFLTLLLSSLTYLSYGVDFTKLSVSEPTSTTYPATFKCYVDVALSLNLPESFKSTAFLRVSYIIGNDTLNDNLEINGDYNGVIKQLFLDEGERLDVILKLNNGNVDMIEGVEGSLRVVRNPDFQPVNDPGVNSFLSSVWKSEQTPLFRIAVEDSTDQFFRLLIDLNKNFEFDQLFLKLKVISPSSGIVMLEKELSVNESPALELRNHSFSIDIKEIDMSTLGTYYFQVMSNMASSRVNGIDKIAYELVEE